MGAIQFTSNNRRLSKISQPKGSDDIKKYEKAKEESVFNVAGAEKELKKISDKKTKKTKKS